MSVSIHSIFDRTLVRRAIIQGVYLKDNWHNSTDTWSRDTRCTIEFAADQFPEPIPVALELSVFNASAQTPRRLTIKSPGAPPETIEVTTSEHITVLSSSPVHAEGSPWTAVVLELDQIVSPAKLGQSSDDRLLGLSIRSVHTLGEGTTFPLNFGNGTARAFFLREGWATPDPEGIWTEGPRARMVFPGHLLADVDRLAIVFDVLPRDAETRPLKVIFEVDGTETGCLTLPSENGPPYVLSLPKAHSDGPERQVVLKLENVLSPDELNVNSDLRPLGLFLRSIAAYGDSDS